MLISKERHALVVKCDEYVSNSDTSFKRGACLRLKVHNLMHICKMYSPVPKLTQITMSIACTCNFILLWSNIYVLSLEYFDNFTFDLQHLFCFIAHEEIGRSWFFLLSDKRDLIAIFCLFRDWLQKKQPNQSLRWWTYLVLVCFQRGQCLVYHLPWLTYVHPHPRTTRIQKPAILKCKY